ncbi:MAG: DUF4386 domain-containing protein [Candidatus Thorarchaeota archaeon]|jgi:hypothetical protein
MIIELFLTGFLFLIILVLNIPMMALGYKMEMGDSDVDTELQKISNDPKRFRISIVIALIEHGCVIALAIMLFIVYSPYSIILGIVWAVVRIGEGLIQFNNEKNYWKLLDIARQYSGTSGTERNALGELANTIFKTKEYRFKFAMVLWAIGTLAYSIVFVTFGVVPLIIGWFGIVVGILIGIPNGLELAKREFKVLLAIGGLSAIVFELVLGGWLIFYSII